MRKLASLSFSAFVLVISSMTFAATGFKYESDQHTLGLWHFDEGSGNVVIDSSKNNIQAVINGEARWNANVIWNKEDSGNSFVFDEQRYVTIPVEDKTANELLTSVVQAVTVEAWVFADSLEGQGGWKMVVTHWANQPGKYHLAVRDGIPQFQVTTNQGMEVALSPKVLEAYSWYHLAGVYDGSSVKIYVDGVLEGKAPHSGTLVTSDSWLVGIGSKHTLEYGWTGLLDEVRISSIARTAEELSPNLAKPSLNLEVVEIPDPNLRSALEKALGKNEGDAITKEDLEKITYVSAQENTNIINLKGLEYCTSLMRLDINYAKIRDLSPLSNLINLESLSLGANQIFDLTPLLNLTNLEYLSFFDNNISGITPLANLHNLTYLDLGACPFGNITPLASLTNLTYLNLYATGVSNITPLSSLVNLQTLHLSYNQIQDITALSGLTKLTLLNLKKNRIIDLSPLVKNTGISGVIDISTKGENNPLNNLAYSTHIPALEARGITVKYDMPEGWLEQIEKEGTTGKVDIPDPNLRAALEKALGKNADDTITDAELATLTELTAPRESSITGLIGLEYCTGLTTLYLYGNQISDISAVANLTKLTDLRLYSNQISDITAVANLTSLTYLNLYSNQISDITAVSNLTNLTELYLYSNQISDITAVANLTSLTSLSLYHNQISDISLLSNLTNLTKLYLQDNQISDISPLSNLTNLTVLNLGENRLRDLIPLKDLANLNELYLGANQITDLSPLRNLSLRTLNLNSNRIIDITPLLEGGGISNTIHLHGNPLSDESIVTHIPALIASGIKVEFSIPEELAKQIEKNKKDGVANVPDPNLRAKLEEILGKKAGDPITKEEMATITTINWWESSTNVAAIESIEGLQFCKSLTFFNLNGSVLLTDLSPIRNLTTLKELYHNESYIDDLSVLSQLTSLASLSLRLSDKVTDLSPLSKLTNLKNLTLSNNKIEDLRFLKDLTQLEFLGLERNRIENLLPLNNLTSLTGLHLNNNRIQDLSPLKKLTNLSTLWVENNRIIDVSPLSQLIALKSLRLVNNRIMDISPLLEGGGISNSMDLRYNPLNEISLTNHLPALILAGVDVSYNEGVDIDKLLADYKPGKSANQTKGSFKLQLPKGLNMISIPVKTSTPITSKSLAQQLNATLVIRLDADSQEFVGYVPDHFEATNFDISGGMGVIVNLMAEKEVTFTGQVWDNVSAAPTAKPLDSSVWAFSVVFDRSLTSPNVPVLIQNMSLPHSQPYQTTTVTGSQKGMAIAVDQSQHSVVNVGDIIQVRMGNKRWRYRLSPQDLENAFAHLLLTEDLRLPNQTALLQNYPNPFNPETWIPFHLAYDSQVNIEIFTIDGRRIRSMDLGIMPAGKYIDRQQSIHWNGRTDVGERVSSGIYYIRLWTDEVSAMRRMVILK